MSQRKGNVYTFGFAIAVCFACSLILSLAATVLKPYQVANIKLDIFQNLLSAVGHDFTSLTKMTAEEVFALYDKEFDALLLDADNKATDRKFMEKELATLGYPSEVLTDLDTGALLTRFNSKKGLLARRGGKKLADYDPDYKLLYVHKDETGTPNAYVVPIMGYGLWDIIKGYVALGTDLNTIKGISFYEHKETPGLGARITEDWFLNNYTDGKKILDDSGKLVSITIAKGKAIETAPKDKQAHYVDGISGATLTGKGINEFMLRDLKRYEPYFKTLRGNL